MKDYPWNVDPQEVVIYVMNPSNGNGRIYPPSVFTEGDAPPTEVASFHEVRLSRKDVDAICEYREKQNMNLRSTIRQAIFQDVSNMSGKEASQLINSQINNLKVRHSEVKESETDFEAFKRQELERLNEEDKMRTHFLNW